jgi:hypothetical protein
MDTKDPPASAVVSAIKNGDVATLKRLLAEHRGLAAAQVDDDQRLARSLSERAGSGRCAG